MKKTLFLLAALLSACMGYANIRLPLLFSDNMVLQRGRPIAVWGWAAPSESITIRFNRQVRQTRADRSGHWRLNLEPEAAGGPYRLELAGKNTLVLTNVLVGEVWICSGQSNMAFQLSRSFNAASEIAAADFPEIRQFTVPHRTAFAPSDELTEGSWQACSPATAGSFTAAGYFFARELYRQLHVPIGLIHSSWGGTHAETWTSREAFAGSDEFRSMIAGMNPPADLAAQAKEQKEVLLKTIQSLQGGLPGAEEIQQGSWKEPAYDDKAWPHMKLPGHWERQVPGLEKLDGKVWFRRTVVLKPEDLRKPAFLLLGKIDDNDEAFLNGVKIGQTRGYDTERRYPIPAGVLKAGNNTIAVDVENTDGEGGLSGEPGGLKLEIGGEARSLDGDWSFRVVSVSDIVNRNDPNSYPTLLFNAMIHPLIPYTIRGFLWYQGESNAGRAFQYRKAFPLLISDWRKQWGLGELPFYFVQLSSWEASGGNSVKGSTWAELREAQAMTLGLPNTGMAVTIDIGETKDIHPRNKQDVGKRLAFIALDHLYGEKMEYAGPAFQSLDHKDNRIVLHFTHIGDGLVARDKYGYLKGFEIAGADQQFHYARAFIQDNTVIVSQDGVDKPVAVRYGWADDAGEANLFNSLGLPAAPFRTDQWKAITEGVSYEIGK